MATNPYASPSGQANLGIGGNQYGGSNPYLQQNIDKSMGDISRQYNNTVAPQRAGAMARSGSFGNSGQQQMQLEDQRNLGETMANTSNQMRMQDYTQQQNMWQQDQAREQQATLANRGMDITKQGQDNAYNLGLGQNSNQLLGINNQFALGKMGDATNRYSADKSSEATRAAAASAAAASRFASTNNYNLGLKQNETANLNNTNNYNLGLRNSDYQNSRLDFDINQGNFRNNMDSADFGLRTYNTLQNGNQTGIAAGTQIQNTPLQYQQQWNNAGNAAGGQGGTESSTMPGSPLTGAAAGYQLGNAATRNLGFSNGGNWADGSGRYAQYQNDDYGQFF